MKDNISKSLEILNVKEKDSSTNNFHQVEVLDFSGIKRTLNIDVKNQESLEKSNISGTLVHDKDLSIEKTGKEIKEKLVAIKEVEQEKKNNVFVNLTTSRQTIGIEPTEKPSQWQVEGIDDSVVSNLPKLYSHKLLYDNSNSPEDVCYDETFETISQRNILPNIDIFKEKRELMNKYNRKVEEYLRCIKELNYLDIYINNLKDSTQYKLSGSQLATLNF